MRQLPQENAERASPLTCVKRNPRIWCAHSCLSFPNARRALLSPTPLCLHASPSLARKARLEAWERLRRVVLFRIKIVLVR